MVVGARRENSDNDPAGRRAARRSTLPAFGPVEKRRTDPHPSPTAERSARSRPSGLWVLCGGMNRSLTHHSYAFLAGEMAARASPKAKLPARGAAEAGRRPARPRAPAGSTGAHGGDPVPGAHHGGPERNSRGVRGVCIPPDRCAVPPTVGQGRAPPPQRPREARGSPSIRPKPSLPPAGAPLLLRRGRAVRVWRLRPVPESMTGASPDQVGQAATR